MMTLNALFVSAAVSIAFVICSIGNSWVIIRSIFHSPLDMMLSTCGEWICRQILSTAVCVSMHSVTISPSRPQLDRLANGNAPQHRPSLRSGKLTAEKKKPSETLIERFREFVVGILFQ